MTCVLDASYALAMILPDENSPADEVMAIIVNGGALVPAHWPTEIVNACVTAVRRGRFTKSEIMRALGDLTALDVEISPADTLERSLAVIDLAIRHGLSVYDAAYLELAVRRKLPLATNDKQLADAARASGLSLI